MNKATLGSPMTPQELAEIGVRLYGPLWRRRLAEVLPVSARTIRNWLSQTHEIRPVVAARIRSLRT